MTQEIIVYRNPGEAALWHMLESGAAFPIMCGIVMFFVVFLSANRLITGGRNWKIPAWKTNTALALGAIAGFGTIYGMWL